jgi:cytochrome c-type biogenesis protein
MVALILTVSASAGKLAYGSSLMFVYALGHGLPLVVIGAVAGALAGLAPVARYAAAVQRVGGWALIAVAGWLIWTA